MPLNFLQRKNSNDGSDNLTEKRSHAGIAVLLLILGAALLLWIYNGHMVSGLVRADAMDYAQLGRNLLNGHGLTTYILRPLALTHGSNAMAQPDVTHGPLYPLLIALAFGVLGVKDGTVQAVSGLFFILTVPMLIFLGQRLFNRTVGILGAVVFMFNPAMLEYAAEATTVPLFVFLATCLFFALDRVAAKAHTAAVEATIRSSPAPLIWTGILSGLLYLTDPLFFWLLPIIVMAVIVWHPHARGRVAFWMLVPLCILILPSMARFAMLTGNPVFGLRGAEFWMGTTALPGFAGYRMAPEDLLSGAAQFKSVLLKMFLAVNTGVSALQRLPANLILLFVLPGLFFRYGDPGVNKVRAVVLACLLGVFVGSTVFMLDPTLLLVAFPGLLLFALAYLTHIAQQAKLKGPFLTLVTAGFAAVLLFPLLTSLVTTRMQVTVLEAEVAHALQKQSRPDEVSFSDQPWIAAWFADRPSIWIPVEDGKLTAIRKQFVNARWLFLTPEVRSFSKEWDMAFSGFMQWDRQYQQATAHNAAPPPSLMIIKNPVPISEALDGFAAVPPTHGGMPSAVLAAVPESAAQSKSIRGKPSATMVK